MSGPAVPSPLPRALFPICDTWRYLNHASVNALAAPVAEAMMQWTASALENGSFSGEPAEHVELVRSRAARLMGVEPDEIAFVKNTSEGLGFVASGIDWHPGDRIVIPGLEFPSNVYPWTALESRGVVVDMVPPEGPGEAVTLEAFQRAIHEGPPPRLLALSWVQFRRGWRNDLATLTRIAHDAGTLVCADVIQGLGVLPAALGEWGVDVAAAGAHKWLLGPPGIGLLFVRRAIMEQLRPAEPGWASVRHREQWDNLQLVWDDSARRYESGTANLVGIAGLGAALDLLLAAGEHALWEHVDTLCRRLDQGLTDLGARVLSERQGDGRSGIVTFELEGHDPGELVEHLAQRKVVVSPRGGGVRASPHGYNDTEDVDALLRAVGEITRRA